MSIYTIRHGSIAALQWVTLPDGKEVSVTDATDGSELRLPRLPLEVQAAVNRQFGIIFALPYGMREQFIKDSVPFTVEVPIVSNDQIIEALFQGETVETLKHNLGLTVEEISGALSNTDLVVCPHCETVSNIGSLVGEHTNDCPVCGYQVLKG